MQIYAKKTIPRKFWYPSTGWGAGGGKLSIHFVTQPVGEVSVSAFRCPN